MKQKAQQQKQKKANKAGTESKDWNAKRKNKKQKVANKKAQSTLLSIQHSQHIV